MPPVAAMRRHRPNVGLRRVSPTPVNRRRFRWFCPLSVAWVQESGVATRPGQARPVPFRPGPVGSARSGVAPRGVGSRVGVRLVRGRASVTPAFRRRFRWSGLAQRRSRAGGRSCHQASPGQARPGVRRVRGRASVTPAFRCRFRWFGLAQRRPGAGSRSCRHGPARPDTARPVPTRRGSAQPGSGRAGSARSGVAAEGWARRVGAHRVRGRVSATPALGRRSAGSAPAARRSGA